jgi:ABC-type branched-subunit amino acid transport system substrate-binding protein
MNWHWGVAIGVAAMLAFPLAASAQTLKIALAASLTGWGQTAGQPALHAAQLAVDEANAEGDGLRIELLTYDDKSDADAAREAAWRVAADGALVVVGPVISVFSLAAGPVYAQAGLVSIAATAHGDRVTANATTFRPVFSSSDMGGALAAYIRHVLGGRKAVVLFTDNGFGRPMSEGFLASADKLGVVASARAIAGPDDRAAAARERAADPDTPPIVLAMTDDDATPLLLALRRAGVTSPLFGSSATASDAFAASFSGQPEARHDPGFFTDGMYAITPSMLDSANGETLAVAARYRTRFGQDLQWEAAQAYDSTRLAIAAVREANATGGASPDIAAQRKAVRDYLVGLDGPEHAVQSLTGSLWFTPDRGRRQATRIGRFHGILFESAPVQLVPVDTATAAERASGVVVETGPGLFARRQQVVYTGIYLNEISRIDIAPSTFTADFYLWLRFANGMAGPGAADATDIDFPDLVRGSFDANRAAAGGDLDDGTTYRLWRIRGDFKNDFDLHRYPYDRQHLVARLFNARAASDQIVYVQDRRSIGEATSDFVTVGGPTSRGGAGKAADTPISSEAFHNLTQWNPVHAVERRDVLVTNSALGDPRLVGVARVRELSGFRLEVDVLRRTIATLAKTLLPLGIMTLIMFASLYFPHGLVKEKITVAITAALSGAVLLSSVNSQLGAVGYTMAVEYVFYGFFGLCLLCIVSVLAAERLRVAGRLPMATSTEAGTRWLYLAMMIVTATAAVIVASRW